MHSVDGFFFYLPFLLTKNSYPKTFKKKGAGCIGLGGAIANAGGIISIASILSFAYLSKLSFDLIIELSILSSSTSSSSSYEELGYKTYGTLGRLIVLLSKGLYSFGCLVAYIVIVKDNFYIAIIHLFLNNYDNDDTNNDNAVSTTAIICTCIMLPLCLLRDITPLEKFSAFKICVVSFIVIILIDLYFNNVVRNINHDVVVDTIEITNESVQEEAEQESSNPLFLVKQHWFYVYHGIFERYSTNTSSY